MVYKTCVLNDKFLPKVNKLYHNHKQRHLNVDFGRITCQTVGKVIQGSTDFSLRHPSALPLSGKRVLITAPRQYATRLAPLLVDAGARPVWVPVLQICEMTDTTDLDRELQQLHEYTHLAFTSRNGISAVLSRLEAIYGGPGGAEEAVQSSSVRLCALGRDSLLLQDRGYTCHVTPQESSTQGLVKQLSKNGELEGAKVLCPVPKVIGLTEPQVIPRFLAALQVGRAHPTRVDAYETGFGGDGNSCNVECQQVKDGYVDAIIFSSTAESEALVKAMGGISEMHQACVDNNVLLAAHGPYTAAGASSVLELPVPCVSKNFSSFQGVVDALGEHFSGI